MDLILIRHPISQANVSQIAQSNEGELHPRGYAQIDELIERFRDEEIDGLYSSDSPRCKELTQRLGKLTGIQPNYSPLFREINNGDFWQKSKEEMNKFRFENETSIAPPNGESLDEIYTRAEQARQYMQQKSEERAVLVSHGLFLKAFIGKPLGLSPKNALRSLGFSNCAMSEINLDNEKIMIKYLNNRDYLRTR